MDVSVADVHFGFFCTEVLGVRYSEVVEDVLENLTSCVGFGQFNYTINQNKILLLELDSVKADVIGSVGSILDTDHVVDDGG